MKTRIAALIAVLMLVLPSSAYALETNELVTIAAMPLAVAAVADLNDVPTSDLVTVVSAMNRASVPAPQFIEVVRYVPVALVDEREPRFVSYVTTQVDRGLVGDELAVSLADQLGTRYDVREINVVEPQTVYLVERHEFIPTREFIPTVVTTRLQSTRFDPLALVAMPLAVAAVANLTDVPTNDLVSFISALNQAAMPAPQFVEVVRYSPMVFVSDTYEPQFVRFVTTEVDRGIRGETLAIAIADRYRTMGIRDIDVINPPRTVIVDRTEFFPPVVQTRVAEARAHPHGGPPGQLKKDLGVQTGAEIVHGSRPGGRVVVARDSDKGRDQQRTRVVKQKPARRDVDRKVTRSPKSGKRNKAVVSAPVAPDHSNRGHQMKAPSQGRPVTRVTRVTPTPSGNSGRGHADKGNSKGNAGGKGKGKGKG
jgi:hypothetical protein